MASALLNIQDANPHLTWSHGRTALATAVTRGDRDMVRLLLDRGVPVGQSVTPWGPAPIHCLSNDVAIAHMLLDAGADPNAPGLFQASISFVPIGNPDLSPQVLTTLLDSGADIDRLRPHEALHATTLLAKQCYDADAHRLLGAQEKVELVISRSLEPDRAMKSWIDTARQRQPPHSLSVRAVLESMARLIEKGADPNRMIWLWRGPGSQPAWADAVNRFVNSNPQTTLKQFGWSHMFRWSPVAFEELKPHQAIHPNRVLRPANVDAVNTAAIQGGRTPLTRAVAARDIAAAQQLLGQGAHINQLDGTGDSPLMVAAQNLDFSMIDLLLKHGAKPNQSASAPSILCLDVAIERGSIPLAKALLIPTDEHVPAQVLPQHIDGAVRTGNLAMVSLMLEHCSRVDVDQWRAAASGNPAIAQAIADKLIEQEPPVFVSQR